MPVRSSTNQPIMVELKAELTSLKAIRNKLVQSAAERIGIFHQIDTYYEVPKGRLKLREVTGKKDAELIYYERENIAEPKITYAFILAIQEPKALKRILNQIMHISAVVDKTREIYFYQGVQIHLDNVKGLGSFIEFERVTTASPEQQKKDLLLLNSLGEKLEINTQNIKKFSYSDLIGK